MKTHYLKRPLALGLTILVLASCSDELTAPESSASLSPDTPDLAVAAANQWITRANLPNTERWGLVSAVVPNAAGQSIFYAIGGASTTSLASGWASGTLTKVQAYNVATNDWSVRASMPLALHKSNGAGVINGKIYVSGGRMSGDKKYQNALLVYDPVTNTWTRKRDMPDVTWGGMTEVIDNRLYVLTCSSEEDCEGGSRQALYRYDPVTDQWTFLSVTPVGLGEPMGGVIGGKLYVAGGPENLLVYDPATNTWTQKASLANEHWSGAGAAVRGKLYVMGGYRRTADGSLRAIRTTSMYDPATDTWTTMAPMPTGRFDFAASRVFVNGQPRIQAVGGLRPGNNLQYIP